MEIPDWALLSFPCLEECSFWPAPFSVMSESFSALALLWNLIHLISTCCGSGWRKHIENKFHLTLHLRVQSPISNCYLLKDSVSCESGFLLGPKALVLLMPVPRDQVLLAYLPLFRHLTFSWYNLQWRRGDRKKVKGLKMKSVGFYNPGNCLWFDRRKLKYKVEKGKRESHPEKQRVRILLVKLIFRNPKHNWVWHSSFKRFF